VRLIMTDPRPKLVTDEVEQGIVAAYQAGVKLKDIEAQFGVARATVYWVLQRNSIAPQRAKKAVRLTGDQQAMAELFGLIEAQDQQIVKLQARIVELEEKLLKSNG
jgi:alkyl sulfatase BDS1-like metallo-beta-lactamase superfamily hydrolase